MAVQSSAVAAASSSSQEWKEPTKDQKPPKDANLAVDSTVLTKQTAWGFLKVGIDHIMLRVHMGMSYSYYIVLYTVIYDYCTQSRPNQFAFSSGVKGGANLQGADLYRSLTSYFTDHCRALRKDSENLSDVDLLKFYAKEWDRYTTGATYVNKLFNYLNKYWVKREKDEGRKEVYAVYTLALVQWRNVFFKHFQSGNGVSRLTQAVLRQIERQRDGEMVDSGLLKRVVESYVLLGIDESDVQRQNLDVYNQYFQGVFIETTKHYYASESSKFVADNSVPDYMKKAEARIAEEESRVKLYLNDATSKPLKDTVEAELITAHKQLLQDEFQVLLDRDRNEDLQRMYSLLSRIQNGPQPLRTRFEEHVERVGLAAVERVMPAPGAVTETGKAEVLEPKAYIEALLDVHGKYKEVVDVCFKAELGFNASLDRACRKFFNKNAAATTSTKSPELLASYCDQLLKKSNKDLDAEALEKQLTQAMIIFDYIDDKDVFQKFYQKKLAQRLVMGLSASDDSESSMISKLKEKCGFDYTNKLQKMFTDVGIGRDLTDRFKEKERQAGRDDDVEGTFMVLGTNFWPLAPQQTDFAVPRELQQTFDNFTRFYGEAHSGRKLTWLWHVSKNEIRTTYLPQKYIFTTSSYQMAILTQFNVNDSLTFKDIQEGTRIAEGYLKPQMALLVKAKVLLQDGDTYELNMNFKSKKIRVNLNQPVRAEQKAEQTDVLAAVDEDRKFVYQATIVRLMKARKRMVHQALIQEVVSTISTKFTPKVPEIKKAIDHLLDQEYLERSEEGKDVYNYMA